MKSVTIEPYSSLIQTTARKARLSRIEAEVKPMSKENINYELSKTQLQVMRSLAKSGQLSFPMVAPEMALWKKELGFA